MSKKEYSIIWKQFSQDSDLGKHLLADNDFALPYFVDGLDKEKFDNSMLDNLQEIHLLKGMLVAYNFIPPTIDIVKSKMLFKKIVEDLAFHFQFDSLEKLILDISALIRRENGYYPSFQALRTGIEFLPDSSPILFDCCADLYNMLERNDFENVNEGTSLFRSLLLKIDKSKINSEFIQHVDTFENWLSKHDNDSEFTLDDLIQYCKTNMRICPQPQFWNKLWDKLNNKQRISSGGWDPPLPLILAAWWNTSVNEKQKRLIEHLQWADKQGQNREIGMFLYSLKENDWFHLDD